MSKVIINTTISEIELKEVGVTISASGSYTINEEEYPRWATTDSINELTPLINIGDLIVNDGINNISTTDRMIDYLKYPDDAFNIRFLSETERSNAFTSKNVQDAIEEARISAIGTLLQYTFIGNGNTQNKWLSYSSGGFASSDLVPMIVPQGSTIKGITFANSTDDVDCNVHVHVNGAMVYELQIRNKRLYWKVGSVTIPILQGDRVSVHVEKYSQGTGVSNPQNVLVTLLGKFTSEGPADSGIQNGL